MIQIKKSFQKRKVKIFLVFLLFSSVAWFITRLSENTTGSAVFNVEYIHIPDSLQFVGASKNEIEVQLKASGFTFLRFMLKNKNVRIDVSKVELNNNVYAVSTSAYEKQIKDQLPKSMELIKIDEGEAIVLELFSIASKKVPVISRLNINLEQNFILDSTLRIRPDSILLKGPIDELNKISGIKTEEKTIVDVNANFTEYLTLQIPENKNNLSFSAKNVTVSGTVVRFSEKIITVPITVMNIPEEFTIKVFPNEVEVLCKGKIDDLVALESFDFEVIADYNSLQDNGQQNLTIELRRFPETLKSAQLMVHEITFILKRK